MVASNITADQGFAQHTNVAFTCQLLEKTMKDNPSLSVDAAVNVAKNVYEGLESGRFTHEKAQGYAEALVTVETLKQQVAVDGPIGPGDRGVRVGGIATLVGKESRNYYSNDLAEAVAKFQASIGLEPNGRVDLKTAEALSPAHMANQNAGSHSLN